MHAYSANFNRPEAILNARRSELKINEVKDATPNRGDTTIYIMFFYKALPHQ
jgi:hypothetical protein